MVALQKRRAWCLGLFVVVLAVGCSDEDTDRFARVGRKLASRLEFTAGAADGRLSRTWQAMHGEIIELAVDARVSLRLRWDKAMEQSQIQVTVKDGVVELKGVVRDADQRRRAVELAQTTLGVTKVNEVLELAVGKP